MDRLGIDTIQCGSLLQLDDSDVIGKALASVLGPFWVLDDLGEVVTLGVALFGGSAVMKAQDYTEMILY